MSSAGSVNSSVRYIDNRDSDNRSSPNRSPDRSYASSPSRGDGDGAPSFSPARRNNTGDSSVSYGSLSNSNSSSSSSSNISPGMYINSNYNSISSSKTGAGVGGLSKSNDRAGNYPTQTNTYSNTYSNTNTSANTVHGIHGSTQNRHSVKMKKWRDDMDSRKVKYCFAFASN
jgi:hypothetical protein